MSSNQQAVEKSRGESEIVSPADPSGQLKAIQSSCERAQPAGLQTDRIGRHSVAEQEEILARDSRTLTVLLSSRRREHCAASKQWAPID